MSATSVEQNGVIDDRTGTGVHLLPETVRLLDALKSTAPALESELPEGPSRIASYQACPETGLPFLWFRISEADKNLLALGGRTAPRFEALQMVPNGFQHHWRSDLVRVFDEQVPLVTRLCGGGGAHEFVVEHVALPVITKGLVREIHGWLMFSDDEDSCREWMSENGASDSIELERLWSVPLPSDLLDPSGARQVPLDSLSAIRSERRQAQESGMTESDKCTRPDHSGGKGSVDSLLTESMLALSLGELPSEIAQVLAKAADDTPDPNDPNALLVAFDHGPYGWLVHVPHPADVRDENIPVMLAGIFRIGRARGAGWVYLEPREDELHLALVREKMPAA